MMRHVILNWRKGDKFIRNFAIAAPAGALAFAAVSAEAAVNLELALAVDAGIDQINCIGIGAGADCRPVIGGVGAFSLQADSFDDFARALRLKLRREVTGNVPEPGTWAMMIAGFGLVGAGLRRRRGMLATA